MKVKIYLETACDPLIPIYANKHSFPMLELAGFLDALGHDVELEDREDIDEINAPRPIHVIYAPLGHYSEAENIAANRAAEHVPAIIWGEHLQQRPEDYVPLDSVFGISSENPFLSIALLIDEMITKQRYISDAPGVLCLTDGAVKGSEPTRKMDYRDDSIPFYQYLPDYKGSIPLRIRPDLGRMLRDIKFCFGFIDKEGVPRFELIGNLAELPDGFAVEAEKYSAEYLATISPGDPGAEKLQGLALFRLDLEVTNPTRKTIKDIKALYEFPIRLLVNIEGKFTPGGPFIEFCKAAPFPIETFNILPMPKERPHDWGEYLDPTKTTDNALSELFPRHDAPPKVHVCIPVYGSSEKIFHYFRITLQSLFATTKRGTIDLTLVLNSVSDKIRAKAEQLAATYDYINVIDEGDGNLGYGGSLNKAYDKKYRYYVISNADVRFTKGWLDGLVDAALRLRWDVGIVAPKCDYVGSPVCFGKAKDGVVQVHDAKTPAVLWLIKRPCWEDVGGFDAEFFPGLFEDDWFVALTRKHGWKTACAGTSWIKHYVNKSQEEHSREYRTEYLNKNQKRYSEKMQALYDDGFRLTDIEKTGEAIFKGFEAAKTLHFIDAESVAETDMLTQIKDEVHRLEKPGALTLALGREIVNKQTSPLLLKQELLKLGRIVQWDTVRGPIIDCVLEVI